MAIAVTHLCWMSVIMWRHPTELVYRFVSVYPLCLQKELINEFCRYNCLQFDNSLLKVDSSWNCKQCVLQHDRCAPRTACSEMTSWSFSLSLNCLELNVFFVKRTEILHKSCMLSVSTFSIFNLLNTRACSNSTVLLHGWDGWCSCSTSIPKELGHYVKCQ